jgi:hypothetical protein
LTTKRMNSTWLGNANRPWPRSCSPILNLIWSIFLEEKMECFHCGLKNRSITCSRSLSTLVRVFIHIFSVKSKCLAEKWLVAKTFCLFPLYVERRQTAHLLEWYIV